LYKMLLEGEEKAQYDPESKGSRLHPKQSIYTQNVMYMPLVTSVATIIQVSMNIESSTSFVTANACPARG